MKKFTLLSSTNQSFDDDIDDTERLEDYEILNQSTTNDRITKLDETLIGRNIPDQVMGQTLGAN